MALHWLLVEQVDRNQADPKDIEAAIAGPNIVLKLSNASRNEALTTLHFDTEAEAQAWLDENCAS